MRALALLFIAAPALAADPVVDRKWGYQIEIPDGWEAEPLQEGLPDVLLLYSHAKSERLLFVSKLVGPTTEDPTLETVESGIRAKATGYKRVSAKKRTIGPGRKNKIFAWDLWFKVKRDGKKVTFATRFLFYKSYALSILVDASGGSTREVRKIVESFVPPPPLK